MLRQRLLVCCVNPQLRSSHGLLISWVIKRNNRCKGPARCRTLTRGGRAAANRHYFSSVGLVRDAGPEHLYLKLAIVGIEGNQEVQESSQDVTERFLIHPDQSRKYRRHRQLVKRYRQARIRAHFVDASAWVATHVCVGTPGVKYQSDERPNKPRKKETYHHHQNHKHIPVFDGVKSMCKRSLKTNTR